MNITEIIQSKDRELYFILRKVRLIMVPVNITRINNMVYIGHKQYTVKGFKKYSLK